MGDIYNLIPLSSKESMPRGFFVKSRLYFILSILNNTFNSFANFQENQIDSISSPTDPAMETWGGDKEAAVTAQNLHLIVLSKVQNI